MCDATLLVGVACSQIAAALQASSSGMAGSLEEAESGQRAVETNLEELMQRIASVRASVAAGGNGQSTEQMCVCHSLVSDYWHTKQHIPFINSSIHSFVCSPVHSSIHPFIHSFIHSSIHSFIPCVPIPKIRCVAAVHMWQLSMLPYPGMSSTK